MSDKVKSDIDDLLGHDPGTDPQARASLAAAVAAALDRGDVPGPDTALVAAYLDGGLSEEEKQAAYAQFAASGAARAELQSAIDLLTVVEKAPQRPAPQVMAQAAALLMTEKKSPAPAKIWQWLWAPGMRLSSGLAFAILVALLVWNPAAQIAPQISGSSPVSPAGGDIGQRALFGGAAPIAGTTTPPSSSTWGAIAISRSAKVYGVARSAPTHSEAEKAALADCGVQHGTDCVVAVFGQGQCFALARQPGGVPVAAMADGVDEASRRAMAICTSSRTEIWPCAASTAFCSGR